MKKVDFSFTGGMPLSQEQLDYMQTGYTEAIKQIGAALGDKLLLSGTRASGGWVCINGEVMPFKGGTGDFCQLSTNNSYATFENGISRPIYIEKSMSFTSQNTGIKWSDFTSLDNITKPKLIKQEKYELDPGGNNICIFNFALFSNKTVQVSVVGHYGDGVEESEFIPSIYAPAFPVYMIARDGSTIEIGQDALCYLKLESHEVQFPTVTYTTQ